MISRGWPLANLPAECHTRILDRPRKSMYNLEKRIKEPLRMAVPLGKLYGEGQPREIIVQHPAPEDPAKQNSKKNPKKKKRQKKEDFATTPSYLMSVDLQHRLDKLGFPVDKDKGPFK